MSALPSIANIAAWYDSTTGLSAEAWLDRSGNGNDLPAVGEPNIVDDIVNGHAVLRTVDGENDNYFQGPIEEIEGPLSFFALFRLRGALSGNMYAAELDHATLQNYIEVYGGSSGSGYFSIDVGDDGNGYASGEIQSAPPPDEWHFCLCTVTDVETSPRFHINGVELESMYETLPFASLAFNKVSAGVTGIAAAITKNIDVAAIGVIGQAINDADRNRLYAWMNTEYGLELPVEDEEESVGTDVLAGVADLLVRDDNGNVAYLTPALREYLESIEDAELLADVADVLHRADEHVQMIMYVPPALKAHLEALT